MKEDKTLTCLGAILAIVVAVVVGVMADGWALSKIWNWFIPPIFGLPVLTLWKAVGVSMVFNLFTGVNRTKKSESSNKDDTIGEALAKVIGAAIAVPVFSVILAWVVFQLAF